MKVQDLMTTDVASAKPHRTLGEVARMMARYDCGIIPVVNEAGKVLGVVTDRDLGLAVGTLDRNASEAPVGELRTEGAYTCAPEDPVSKALKTCSERQVRRLPVVDANGRLRGLLSLNDVVLAGVLRDQVLSTMKGIAAKRRKPSIRRAGFGAAEEC